MTVLKNVLSFTGLVIGVPSALPHGLNVNGTDVAPQLVLPAAGGYTITASATSVSVTRLATGAAAVQVFVERWHTIENVLPATELAGLVPFIPDLAGVSGTTTVTTDGATVSGDGSIGDPLVAQGAISPVSAVLAVSGPLTRGLSRIDSTVGAITGTLPAANLYTDGELFGFTSVGGGIGPITVAAAGGDTIGGLAALIISSPERGYVFVSDGVSNWCILGTYPP